MNGVRNDGQNCDQEITYVEVSDCFRQKHYLLINDITRNAVDNLGSAALYFSCSVILGCQGAANLSRNKVKNGTLP